MIGMALVQELWQFYVIQIAARFLALGVISLALSIMIPKWFVAKRARAVAFSGLGGRLGNAITPIYVQFLVSVYSWRVATVTTGLVMLAVTLLPVALFVKRQPEDLGLLPDGVTPEEKARQQAAARAGGRGPKADISFTLKQVAQMPAFYLLLGAQTFGSIVGPALNLHMVPYFTDKGLTPAVAVAATTTLFISSALGSLLFGFLAERFGIKRVVTIDYVFMGVGFIFLLMVNSPAGAIAWGIYMGVVQGGGMTLNQVLFADYFGRGSLGAIRGATTPIQLGTNAVGPMAAAIAYDVTGNYVSIFLAFGVFRALSGLLILLAKAPAGSAADLAEKGEAAAAAR
jgi:MFS family permease